jgi:hypothetical protein
VSYLDEATIAAIDARIAKAQKTSRAVGTVAQRDTTGPGAMVVFDGTSIAQPVKVLGHVHVDQDDRVALELFGSSWVVIGSFNRHGLATSYARGYAPSGSESTSTSWTDAPGPMSILGFQKRYDDTYVLFQMTMTTQTDIQPTVMQIGIRVSGVAGTDTGDTFTPVEILLSEHEYDIVGNRISPTGFQRYGGMPAGSYDLTARWRRTSGTGKMQATTNDIIVLTATETFG